MASVQILASIQQVYLAYFGRPADPEGLAFWAQVAEQNGGSVESMMLAFTTAPEAIKLYGDVSGVDIRIDAIYQNVFGRNPDAQGEAFWKALVDNGEVPLENLALLILAGANGNADAVLVQNKLIIAQEFTAQIETQGTQYAGEAAAAVARTLINSITNDPASLTAAQAKLPAYLNTVRVASKVPEKFTELLQNGVLKDPSIVSTTLTEENIGTTPASGNFNDAPETTAAAASGAEDAEGIDVVLAGTDVDGTVAGFVIKSLPANGVLISGTAVLEVGSVVAASNNSATVTFVPAGDFNGEASFTFAARDDEGLEAATAATATVTVEAVNDAPVAADDSATTEEDTAVIIDVLANDTDVDSANLSIKAGSLAVSATNSEADGTAVITDGKIVFTPAAHFNGIATIDYVVTDGTLESPGSVEVTVSAVNDAPETTAAAASGAEDAEGIDVVLAGTDVDSTVAGFVIKSLPANGVLISGTAVLEVGSVVAASNNSATVTFVPAGDFNGEASFTFAARDDEGLEAATAATATVTVEAANVAPTDIALSSNVVEENAVGSALIGTLSATDGDPNDIFSYALVVGGNGNDVDNELVEIINGELLVKAGAVIDFETNPTLDINVQVTDAANATFTKAFTVVVTDIDENTGPNTFFGTSGPDVINGTSGNDIIIGGLGADETTGGPGVDVFVIGNSDSGLTTQSVDVIRDFNVEGDKIDLEVNVTPYFSSVYEHVWSVEEAVYLSRWYFIGFEPSYVFLSGLNDGYLLGDIDGDRNADFAVTLVGLGSNGGNYTYFDVSNII